jgi:hypothetical protein
MWTIKYTKSGLFIEKGKQVMEHTHVFHSNHLNGNTSIVGNKKSQFFNPSNLIMISNVLIHSID